jgi:hypothetical protein
VCEREREKLAGRNGEELAAAAAAAVSPPTQMKPPTPVTILSLPLLPLSSRNNYRKIDIQGRLPFPLPPTPAQMIFDQRKGIWRRVVWRLGTPYIF